MAWFEFIYETDSETDDGYRAIEAPDRETARLEWVRQVTAEGQTVRLDAIQGRKTPPPTVTFIPAR